MDIRLCVTRHKINNPTHLWKELSTRSLAFFLEVAIWHPRARPSASRILAFLPKEHTTEAETLVDSPLCCSVLVWDVRFCLVSQVNSAVSRTVISLEIHHFNVSVLYGKQNTYRNKFSLLTGAFYGDDLKVIICLSRNPTSPFGLFHPRNLP